MLANIVRDVTDRKQTADRLRQQATYLETLLESSVGAIIAYSPDGRVLSWNRAAEHMYGWSRHEVIGQPLPVVPGNLAAQNADS